MRVSGNVWSFMIIFLLFRAQALLLGNCGMRARLIGEEKRRRPVNIPCPQRRQRPT